MAKTTLEKPKLPYAGRGDTIKIFKLIHERKEPTPINEQKLKTLGIGLPIRVIAMLKAFDFIDENGMLTPVANDLRGTPEKFRNCLEEKVKIIYEDLFNTVKDVLSPEKEAEVRSYFRNHITHVKDRMLQIITTCFLTLRDIITSDGKFNLLDATQKKPLKEIPTKPKEKNNKTKPILKTNELQKFHPKDIKLILNLNVNLDIGTSKEAIEELFKNISLARESVFGEVE